VLLVLLEQNKGKALDFILLLIVHNPLANILIVRSKRSWLCSWVKSYELVACLGLTVLIVIQSLPVALAVTPIPPNNSSLKASKANPGLKLYPLTPILDNSNENQSHKSAKDNGSGIKQDSSTVQNQITYPDIDKLEQITFGYAKPDEEIQVRLNALEMAVLHQTFPQQSIKMRSQRLNNEVVLGSSFNKGLMETNTSKKPEEEEIDSRWQLPEYQVEMSTDLLEHEALQQINEEREKQGLKLLEWDELAAKIAKAQVKDMCNRNIVSHFDQAGRNPDLRYTSNGGDDAITESVLSLPNPQPYRKNRALIGHILTVLNKRQDDRDALFSTDATHFGFSFATTAKKDHLIVCAEVITRHAIMHPIPPKVTLGQKIEIKGVMLKPYQFDRVTLAWEGIKPKDTQTADEGDEALPYFPPLDFAAYGLKAEHREHEKALMIIRTAGMIAAIAGGLFIPPIALAAPLIALSGTNPGEPHAVSEIPVHGGIKLDGNVFHGDVPVSNSGKLGMYYVTVWASREETNKPIPISRRIIMVTSDTDEGVQVRLPKHTALKTREETGAAAP